MRVAFCGTHRTGKSTLLAAVAERLRGYDEVDEPYHLLEEDGYEHADPPSVEDFRAQLARSVEALDDAGRDALFDRCPADCAAYLQAMGEALDDDEREQVRDGLASLDLIVLVTIESPDRIALPSHEDARLRRRMDEAIRGMLLDEGLAGETPVLEVGGPVAERVAQVLGAIGRR